MTKKKNTDVENQSAAKPQFVFGTQNYRLLLIALAVVVLGFVLMHGKEDIYDFRKTTLAPIVVIAGFVIAGVSIMKKPKGE